jgi:tetratricopeptide (TPR) repeat protein
MRGQRLDKLLELLAQNESDTFILYALAMEYLGLNQNELAENYFRRCLQVDSGYLPAYYMMGILLNAQEKEKEALVFLYKGLELVSLSNDEKTKSEFKNLIEEIEF